MNRVLCVVIIALLVACGALSLGLNHYRDNAITYKEQRDKKVSELELANATITDMQQRAERDYFILRERLMTMQKQLEGAQDYIRTQCTKQAFYYPEDV
nr:lysis system i-spanin subunit Rz [Escherichia coli]